MSLRKQSGRALRAGRQQAHLRLVLDGRLVVVREEEVGSPPDEVVALGAPPAARRVLMLGALGLGAGAGPGRRGPWVGLAHRANQEPPLGQLARASWGPGPRGKGRPQRCLSFRVLFLAPLLRLS